MTGKDAETGLEASPPSGKKLTVLQVVPELNSGGVERGAIEIARRLVADGHRALIASKGGRMEGLLKNVGGELVRLPLDSKNPLTLKLNARRLADVIETLNVDIVHARSRAPAWSAYWACQRQGTPFVTTYHGAYSEGLPGKRRYNSVMAKGDRVIAISQFIADLIRERHETPEERLVVIHRGADLELFNPAKVSRSKALAMAERWGVADDDRPIFLLPGRLTRWKGQEDLIDAAAALRDQRGEDFLCVILGGDEGDGGFEKELQQRIEKRDLGRIVRMVGHEEDMTSAYWLSSVVVSASRDPEAFGRIAVEGQAMGKPVIATAHGGAMETVEDEVTGFHVAPGDPESLAAAMGRLCDLSSEQRAAIGQRGIARVEEAFGIASMQAATMAVYRDLVG
ncbi:MAG: glycosyltransferase family 4 protein [Pseudomonadota bacterium]